MCIVRKADYYYGALLSVLVNNEFSPVMIEAGNKRKIYGLFTDNGDEYQIYSKFLSKPSSNGQNSSTWSFVFSDNEIEEIKTIKGKKQGKDTIFAFICSQNKLNNTEIALIKFEELEKCIDLNRQYQGQLSVSIRRKKGSHGLWVYGTNRSLDYALKVSRDVIKNL
ncbi:hypothetical protein [Natranaerobius thermophilus]|uniref:Uncharacterized protein n=1 Tax=Natranaerobius thermophilus (strain ATCC BAA-1301 / DSM 18059 / JW/NM-WN-LF) TaxID=457570 RepID=B2A7S6_NATTJ|nr:hypothetical protein [Natranaerobius thermophilus]ACB84378.1 conserved hypothetical protein [Natranaerobius thermophilus JW/NM-WN-LF]